MEDEDDIWDYKSSVGKRKSKKLGSGQTNNASQLDEDKSKPGQQKKKAKKTKRGTTLKKMEKEPVITIEDAGTPEKQTQTKSQRTASASKSSGKKSAIKSSQTPVRKIHEGFCPVCQMPFRILPLSPSWHVRECMESPNAEEECPDGASCDNTMESHYKEYAHQTLAMIRSTAEFSPTDENGTCKNGTKMSAKVRLEFSEIPVRSDHIAVSVEVKCLPKQKISTTTEKRDSNKENMNISVSNSGKVNIENVTKIKDKKSEKSYGSNENIDDILDDDDNDIISSPQDLDDVISSPQDISEIIDSMEPDDNKIVQNIDKNDDDDENEDLSAILLEELIPTEDDESKNGSARKRKSLRGLDEDVSPKKQALISEYASSENIDYSQDSSGLSKGGRVSTVKGGEDSCTSGRKKMMAGSKRKSSQSDIDNFCSQKSDTRDEFGSPIDFIDLSQGDDGDDMTKECKPIEKKITRSKRKSVKKLEEGVSPLKQAFLSNAGKNSGSQNCSQVLDDTGSKGKQSKEGSSQKVDADEIDLTPKDNSSQSTQTQKNKKRLSLSRKKSKTGKNDQNQTALTSFFKCSSMPLETIAAKVKKEECFVISDSDSDANIKNVKDKEQTAPLEGNLSKNEDTKSTVRSKSPCLLTKKAMQTVKKLVQEAKKKHSFDQQQKEEIIEVKSDSSKCESETDQSDSSTNQKFQSQKKSALDLLMKKAKNNMTKIQEKSDVACETVPRIRYGPGYMSFPRIAKDGSKSETAGTSAAVQPCGSTKPAVSETRAPPPPPISKASNRSAPKRKCPFYKKIPETGFTVDAFSYGDVPGCTGYILSHFHYDHYNGLTKHFTNPIYCSQITANLVLSRIKVKEEFVHPIPMNTPCLIDNIEITMLEANHCPGSVLILFRLPSGRVILHTGDFRADKSMEDYPEFKGVKFSQLYLDTTYCNPTYDFPPQKEVIDFAVDLVKKELTRNPKTLIVCGSYTIGKERIFIAIAQALGCKICVYKDKRNVMSCLDDSDLFQKLSLDFNDSQLHVLQLGKLNPKGLGIHMSNLKTKYSNVIALEPTGWSYGKINSLQEIKPKYNRDGIKIFGIPYSEHSSYLEMKRFVQFIKPERIIPTVNNGNPKARKKMEDIFKSWFQELQQGQGQQAKVTVKQSSISTWFA